MGFNSLKSLLVGISRCSSQRYFDGREIRLSGALPPVVLALCYMLGYVQRSTAIGSDTLISPTNGLFQSKHISDVCTDSIHGGLCRYLLFISAVASPCHQAPEFRNATRTVCQRTPPLSIISKRSYNTLATRLFSTKGLPQGPILLNTLRISQNLK